jgi:hypothetical protein
MSDFTSEINRDNSIKTIPRLTFQMPQSTTSATPSTQIPIYFCQVGCQLEFEFTNITSATLKNDGTYFTIIPTDNSNNYINWNGTGASGQNMIRFDLKEIKFSAPAKDLVGSINYNKSIQFYFTFVNSTYPKIMIIITVIGQSNNVGTAQTDGFILLNTLAPQIPTRNDVKKVSNLNNVNLGNLLPANKSFFSTLINTNSIQYISMTRIIDIPVNFLNYMISMVVGGKEAYDKKVNNYSQQIPSNPQGTIIFYTENIKPINSNQAYVCNANCDRVVGDASLLQPTIGTSSTQKNEIAYSGNNGSTGGTIPGKPIQEECEEEYVFPGTKTNVNVNLKSGATSSGSNDSTAGTSNDKNLSKEEYTPSVVQSIIITLFILIIVVGCIVIIIFLGKATNISGFRSFFSRELWNSSNLGWIFTGLLGFCSIIIFTSIALDIMIKQYKTDKDKITEDKKPWIYLIIGLSIYIICFGILIYKSRTYSTRLNTYRSVNNYSPTAITRRTSTISGLPINSTLPQFKGISGFNTQASKIISDYQKSPSSYFKPGSQGITDILSASKQYSELPQLAKDTLAKYNPSITPYLNPKGEFIKNIQSSSPQLFPADATLSSLIESLKYYNQLHQTPALINQQLIDELKFNYNISKNKNLEDIINGLIVGNPIPLKVYEYVSKLKRQ